MDNKDPLKFYIKKVQHNLHQKQEQLFASIKQQLPDLLDVKQNVDFEVDPLFISNVEKKIEGSTIAFYDKEVADCFVACFAIGVYLILKQSGFKTQPKMSKGAFKKKIKYLNKYKKQIKSIKSTTFDRLNGFNNAISSQIKKILIEGLRLGKPISKIAKELSELKNITLKRGTLIARTELSVTNNLGIAVEIKNLQASYDDGKELKAQWISTLDTRVRPEHKRRHLKIMSVNRAISLMGEYNCRCTIRAAPKTLKNIH